MKYSDLHQFPQPGKQLLIISATLFFSISSDQYTKFIAKNYLTSHELISNNSSIINFPYVENSAGFLSILNGLPEYIQFFLLNICVALLLIYCLYYLFFLKNRTILNAFALALITGGGMSNLVDRIINNGRVIDFIQLGTGSFKTGIFNLADIYILAGSFLFGFLILSADSQ